MSKGRSKKRYGLFLGVFMLVMAFCVPVAAGVAEGEGKYEVYPTPQEYTNGTGTTTLTDQVDVTYGEGIDSYTQKRVEDTLDVLDLKKSTAPADSHTKLIVGIYGSNDAADQLKAEMGVNEGLFGVENRFDVYSLYVSNGRIVILGEDTDAAYYGVTTLKRIFEQLNGNTIQNLMIKDYADIEFRGFIEGYYGNPWSHEDRIDLMQFGSEIKMNQYIYAPKDDPLHNSSWRQLYDEEGLKKISELAQAGNESKCFFVYALHTFMNSPINFNNYDAELKVVQAKFSQVIKEAGVRQIAILEDDAAGASAENIIRYMNDMNNWLKQLKAEDPELSDLKTDILYCPTCYMNTTNAKMAAISKSVSSEIHIVVTGGKVWGEISEEFSNNFHDGVDNKTGNNEGTGRYPYMWVNWPCNDNTKTSAIMGGHNYILHTGVQPGSYEGVVLNPIQESETSKVGIFTAADYCWKLWTDAAEGDQAWEDSFKYINHMTPIESEESNALREVARHMITQGPDQTVPGKQVQFDESVNIKDQITEFQGKLEDNSLEKTDLESLKSEFQKIKDAADLYLDPNKNTNKRTVAQIKPFLSCLRDMVGADLKLIEALAAEMDNDKSSMTAAYLDAQALYERSKTYGFSYYGAGIIYAQAARKYITPFTGTLLEYVAEEVKTMVNPEGFDPSLNASGEKITSSYGTSIQDGSYDNLNDKNDDTFIWFNQNLAVGDWLQYDLGAVWPVESVRILVGNDSNGKGSDKWNQYHLEYSEDGVSWQRLDSHTGSSTSMDTYEVDMQSVLARYIRLVNDQALVKWARFSEFTVVYDAAKPVYTNKDNTDWKADWGVDTFSVREISDLSLAQGEYIGIKLDRICEIKEILTSGTGLDSLVLEKSVNEKEWTQSKEGNARYIRLINKGGAAVNVSIQSFTVKTKEILPMDLLEKDFPGEPDNNTKNWMDGNLSTATKFGSGPTQAGQYITYDLGQEIELRSLKVYVLDTDYDYPRDAVIQASVDNENWEDVLTIGDGIADTADMASVKPAENGWTHDTVDVAYSYMENANINHVKARYLRMKFTAPYTSRWVKVNEIRINGGEYIPSVNDPTFELEENVALKKGFEPQNLRDGNITTAFQPDGTKNSSLIYHLSDDKKISRINILQSGSAISNAVVSVRTGEDTWEEIGKLDESYSAFYVKDLENVYAVKLEWKDVVPTIYEIITLEDTYEDMADFLEKEVQKAKAELDSVKQDLEKAKDELKKIQDEVKAAQNKVNTAPNEVEKLKAEVELQNLLAKQSAAEAVAAEKEAVQLDASAAVSQATVKKLLAMIDAAADGDKQELESQLDEEKQAVTDSQQQAEEKRTEAANKKTEQKNYEQEAIKKNNELKNVQQKQNVTSFTVGSLNYNVINASAKTVTVTGPTDKKKVKTVTIAPTVSYGGITWNVTEISANAFKGCKNLKKVTIGSNITKIGNSAFAGCKKLKTINMKKAAKITSFGKKTFKGIGSKAKITVPKKQLKAYKKKLKKTGLPKTAKIK